MRRLIALFTFSAAVACSFTTAGNFHECDSDIECGAAAACVEAYCLPLPEGCTRHPVSTSENDPYQNAGSIPFAALLPLEDDASEVAGLDAFALAMTQVNNVGGLQGNRLFALYVCDTKRSERVLQEQLEWMVTNAQVPAVFTSGSSQTEAAANNTARKSAGTLIISATATSPALSSVHASTGNVWRVAPDDTQQAQVIVKRLVQRDVAPDAGPTGKAVIGVAWEDTSYGRGLAEPVALALEGAGYEAVRASFGPGAEKSNSSTTLGNNAPQATVVVAFPADVRSLAEAMKRDHGAQPWFPEHRWFLADAAKDPVVAQGDAGVLLHGAWGSAPSQGTGSTDAFNPFRAAYRSAFNNRDPLDFSFTSHSYDAAWLMMLSAAWAANDGGVTGPRMGSAFPAMQRQDVVRITLTPNNWQELSNTLARGAAINADGVSGALTFNLDSGCPTSPYELWRVLDGGIVSSVELVNP